MARLNDSHETHESNADLKTKATVRMYRQGFGDCFLLKFETGEHPPYHVLIDCGVIGEPLVSLQDIVEDIGRETANTIDLLVITHQHMDHVSGFLRGDLFQGITVHNLWLAWTENPNHKLAQDLIAKYAKKALEALHAATGRAVNAATAGPVKNILEFYGNGDGVNGLAANGNRPIKEAMDAVRKLAADGGGEVNYLLPGQGPLDLPVLQDKAAPPVRVYVLGPPESEAALRNLVDEKELYQEARALSPRTAFMAALGVDNRAASGNLPLDTSDLEELSSPFDARLRIKVDQAKKEGFFKKHYYGIEEVTEDDNRLNYLFGEKSAPPHDPQEWRQIEDDWLNPAQDMAMQLNSFTNNTSLALAFELPNSEKVLLFPADAQVGNWLSWGPLHWTVAGSSVTTENLLSRTVLYKAGHHASHNATLKAKGLEQMATVSPFSEQLVVMIPVSEATALSRNWNRIPFSPLLKSLEKKAQLRVLRSDRNLERHQDMSDEEWEAFTGSVTSADLYHQCVIIDE